MVSEVEGSPCSVGDLMRPAARLDGLLVVALLTGVSGFIRKEFETLKRQIINIVFILLVLISTIRKFPVKNDKRTANSEHLYCSVAILFLHSFRMFSVLVGAARASG